VFCYIWGVISALNLLGDTCFMVINVLNLVEHASCSFINSQFVPFYLNDRFFLFRPLALFLVRCNFSVHHTFLVVNFTLVHCVFILSTICCTRSLFLFVAPISLSVAHDISQYFVFSFFVYFFSSFFFFLYFCLPFYEFYFLIYTIVHYIHDFPIVP
jgi:hypothetical protein